MARSRSNSWLQWKLRLRFRLRPTPHLRLRFCTSHNRQSPAPLQEPAEQIKAGLLIEPCKCEPVKIEPVKIEPVKIEPNKPIDATPLPDNQDLPVAAGKHRVRPGLPPALLLVLTPIRKRLTSREFWLGAIVVVWAIAALTIG
jgi:hypothetical protein